MKAVRYHSYGGSDVLVYEEVDRPVAGVGQVVVRVAGTAFNPTDAGIRAGLLQDVLPVALPHVPNTDVAGVITEVGEGVSGWSAGDAVVAFLPGNAPGASAEYVAAPADVLVAAPRTGELADAAALPLPGLTAWQSLFEHADLKPGQSILINGAGGAVGGYAVQLAARAGATVTATASARSRDRVRSYGADRIVDYTEAPVWQAVAGQRFDVVLNLAHASPEEIPRLVDLVVDGGAFVSITTPGMKDAGRGVRTVQAFVRGDAAQLAELVARVDAGELTIEVAERLPLVDTAVVHARFAAQLVELAELVARVDDGSRGARASELAERLRADLATVDAPAAGQLAGKTVLTPTTSADTTTMAAISQDTLGGPEVLRVVRAERPVPGPTEVLVRVRAAGLNPADWKHRAVGGWLGVPPFVLGWDVSGVVAEVGLGVALYRPGDEVFGMLHCPTGHGAHAEYVTAPARTFVRKPSTVDHTHAAAVPLAGLTAWQALVDTANVRAGQRVLVHAAAGGVGHLAVQIAKAHGAYVIGTASAAKHDFVYSLGADEVIDYRTVDFTTVAAEIDIVIDTIGGEYGPRSLVALRQGGVLVSLVLSDIADGLADAATARDVRAEAVLVEPDHAAMRSLAELLAAGRLTVHVEQTFPLADAAKAHRLGETGRVTGKLVLTT